MISAKSALKKLKEGNARFVSSSQGVERAAGGIALRQQLVTGQNPHSIVLGCSDSRVPVETIFDQDFGDLFVIRVAGNIAEPSQIASIEFAAVQLGAQLVVVLGHTGCGAVSAAIAASKNPEEVFSDNLSVLLSHIVPSVEEVAKTAPSDSALLQAAVRANICATVRRIKEGSVLLRELSMQGKLEFVGAEYCLEAGTVEFLDGQCP